MHQPATMSHANSAAARDVLHHPLQQPAGLLSYPAAVGSLPSSMDAPRPVQSMPLFAAPQPPWPVEAHPNSIAGAQPLASGNVFTGLVEKLNPIGDLQGLVAVKLGRPVAKGDISYTFEVCAVPRTAFLASKTKSQATVAAIASSGFVACLKLRGIDGITPGMYMGAPRLCKREAKRSAAEAALANRELLTALHGRSGPTNAGLTVSGDGPGTDGFGPASNPVGELQEMVQQAARHNRSSGVEDIVYSFDDSGAAFVATVVLVTSQAAPEPRWTFVGSPKPNKREAKRSAAEAVLVNPPPELASLPLRKNQGKAGMPLSLGRASATHQAGGNVLRAGRVVTSVSNPVGELQERLMRLTKLPVKQGDVEYTLSMTSDNRFVARVDVTVLEGNPSSVGIVCGSKRDAKSAAARSILNDKAFQIALPVPRHGEGVVNEPADLVASGSFSQTVNPVSTLQEYLQHVVRRLSTKHDIVYTFEAVADGNFVSTVLVKALDQSPRFTGTASANKKKAKQSAAAEALKRLSAQNPLGRILQE